ncbi:MAG: class I SAM-dependent DNA methyltransferase, partial [Planctomycetota bacterium]
FGTLLERALDPRERHKLGAHFTPRAYVERLVVPTIIEPVRDDWEAARAASLAEANAGRLAEARGEARKFLAGLTATKVLDPACGTGNFLYVSMVKLKEIEAEARDWLAQLGETQADLAHMERTVDPQQFLGIEINPRAVAIAEVVLWIGWLQWHLRDRKTPESFSEPILQAYGNIECRDALLEYDTKELVRDEAGKPVTRWDGVTTKKHPVTGEDVPDDSARVAVERYLNPRKAEWPQADFVVGNPPFLGSKRMRECLGDGYVDALQNVWPEVPQATDFVLRWWHKAAELLRARRIRRFGLVTTNSIGQAYNRRAIESHVESGNCNLAFAIPDHPWVDSADGAAVRIAMTVASADMTPGALLTVEVETATDQGDEIAIQTSERVGVVNSSLQLGANTGSVAELRSNSSLCCVGIKTIGSAFVITPDDAETLGRSRESGLSGHIRHYVNGRELSQIRGERMVIDLFGLGEKELQSRFPAVYQHLLHGAKPERDLNRNKLFRETWWVIGHPRPLFRQFTAGLARYIATIETSKHRFFLFLPAEVLPDSTIVTFGLEDAAALGVMSSRIHVVWALAAGGTLEDRPRYNKTTCFDPFPFPAATDEQKQTIRDLGEALDAHRKKQQAAHAGLTITGMYNVLEKLRTGEALTAKEKTIHDDGLVSVLKKIHDDLDAAVFAAYGWPATLSDDEILERLVALNHERAAEEKRGLIRWLRPEFQAKAGGDVQLAIDAGDDDEIEAADAGDADAASKPKRGRKRAAKKAAKKVSGKAAGPARSTRAAKATKQAWPKDLAEQTRAVRGALAGAGGVITAADMARQFKHAKAPRVEEILDTLVALGHARRTDSGYAPA